MRTGADVFARAHSRIGVFSGTAFLFAGLPCLPTKLKEDTSMGYTTQMDAARRGIITRQMEEIAA
ncbi:MAG: thiamine biosynthesis protein ThiC, partial [Massilioclostridium sp.]|nr:thiamine biosynthesis protein ThiC [Massilioclostridium sp.]